MSPVPIHTNGAARRLFDDLNRRFFSGRLAARIEWSGRLTASAGTCLRDDRVIRLSIPYHERSPRSLPVTLAHEMCHLVAPKHDAEFRRIAAPMATALGVPWETFRYARRWADLERYAYVYACPACGAELPSRKRRRVSCGRCSPRVYREEFRMRLTESRVRPGPVLTGRRPARNDG